MRIRALITWALLGVALCLVLTTIGLEEASAAHAVPGQSVSNQTNSPQVVEVGAVPITIYGVDQEDGTYFGDFYLWFRWTGSIDPVESTEILNNVEKWGTTLTPIHPQPIKEADGSLYQVVRLDGRFDNNFALSRFPLDHQTLNLVVENSAYTADHLVYQPAPASDLQVEPNLEVQGWSVGSWTATAGTHDYNTNFGRPDETHDYSQVTFSLELSRPPGYFVGKLLLPLVVVILMGIAALLVAGNFVEARIAMPSTAILAAVFLQLTYTEDLPNVTGLVLMDRLYIVSYIALTVVLARVVYSGYATKRHTVPDYSTRRSDLMTLASVIALLVIGTLAVLLLGL